MNYAQVEQHHEIAKLLERRDPVFADGKGDRAEHAQRRQADDEADNLEQGFSGQVDDLSHRLAALAQQAQTRAEQDSEQQHLERIALGEGVDDGRRNDTHQEIDDAALHLRHSFRISLESAAIERRRVDIHAMSGREKVSNGQAHDQGDRRDNLEIDDGLGANAPNLPQVAGANDTVDDDTEDQRCDDHLDQFDEAVAERLELGSDVRPHDTDQNAKQQCNHYLAKK